MSEVETVKALVHTESQAYFVWAPADLADQLAQISESDEGWVTLAHIDSDECICLRAKDIVFFKRDMTVVEKERKHSIDVSAKWIKKTESKVGKNLR